MGNIPGVFADAILRSARRRAAEGEIDRVWTSSGGVPGTSHGDLIEIGEGFYRQYVDDSGGIGRVYVRPGSPGWLGFLVYGAIGEKYIQLGGPDSWLGWPTSGEQPFDQGGRVSTFQNGAIYWWPDTGAIEFREVVVRYTGLACFGETDNDQNLSLSTADEPYVLFGIVPAVPGEPSAPRTRIYEDVDSGDSREDSIELYRGLPYGLSISAVLMEHDLGDPDKYREQVKQGVNKASEAVVSAAEAIPPPYGPAIALVVKVVLDEAGPYIVDFVNDTLDTQDDHIGTVSFIVTPKDMVTLSRVERQNFRGILWHMDSPLISGLGASYKVYVDIQAE